MIEFALIGFVAGMLTMVIINLYKYVYRYVLNK